MKVWRCEVTSPPFDDLGFWLWFFTTPTHATFREVCAEEIVFYGEQSLSDFFIESDFTTPNECVYRLVRKSDQKTVLSMACDIVEVKTQSK